MNGLARNSEEHQQLLSFIDHYALAIGKGHSRRELIDLLKQVSDYERVHRKEEEALMERMGYPGLIAHRQEHDRLMARIAELLLRVRNADEPAIRETESLLKTSFMEHLAGPDAEFHLFLSQRRGGALRG